MPEILTESFCERCGTRYTFESSESRTKPLRGLKTFSRGLRNFVMSDDTSMDEAMAAARSEADRDVTSRQLDAFHSTFNFCMSCRQYTCANCWNDADGTCLTCSPLATREAASPGAFPAVDVHAAHATPIATNGTPEASAIEAPTAWPMANLDVAADEVVDDELSEIDLGARLAALDMVTDGPLEAGPGAVDTAPEATAAAPEPVASEPEPVAVEPGPEVEPVALEPEPVVVEPEPEQVAAAPAPEPVAPEPEPEPIAAAQPPQDVVQQPVWLQVAPDPDAQPLTDAPATDDGLAAAASASPQWPTQPEWPSQPQWPSARTATQRPSSILGRPVVPSGGIDALWAASSKDVLAPPMASAPTPLGQQVPAAAQPCVNCGLSLSSTARFCRRCGTAQTHA
jgi:hypothetical protein